MSADTAEIALRQQLSDIVAGGQSTLHNLASTARLAARTPPSRQQEEPVPSRDAQMADANAEDARDPGRSVVMNIAPQFNATANPTITPYIAPTLAPAITVGQPSGDGFQQQYALDQGVEQWPTPRVLEKRRRPRAMLDSQRQLEHGESGTIDVDDGELSN